MEDSLQYIITVPTYVESVDSVTMALDSAVVYRPVPDHSLVAEQSAPPPPPPPAWQSGIKGTVRNIGAGDNSGVLVVVAALVLAMMLCYRSCRRLLGTLYQELTGMRRRSNVFDERTTNETRLLVLMGVQWSVYTGLLLYSMVGLHRHLPAVGAFGDVMQCVTVTAIYYIVQLVAYFAVGYTFSSIDGCRLYVRGFTASQSLLGYFLMVPALAAIFYPESAPLMLVISGVMYLTARLAFIVKGFRIFYNKIYSLCYFILYLCTLEIVPIICIYNIALTIG